MRLSLPAAITLFTLSGAQAMAGVVVTSATIDLETKQSTPSMIYADTDKLKVVGDNNIIIYRGDLKKLWIITPGRKSYVEMTPESMRQLQERFSGANAQMQAAQAQMQAKLATLPPAQRAQIEAAMAKQGMPGGPPGGAAGGAPKATIAFTKAGPNKSVANMRCDIYRKTTNGQQEEDVCITPITSAGLTANDFKVLDSLSQFSQPLTGAPQARGNDFMDWNGMNKAIGFQGLPLDTIHYVSGKPSRQDTVQKIERQNIPANTFELPAGYAMQEMPGGPPGR